MTFWLGVHSVAEGTGMKAAAPRRSAVEVEADRVRKNVVSTSPVEPVPAFGSGDSAAGPAPPNRAPPRKPFAAVAGTAADHPAVLQFLTALLQRPSPSEFQAQLEDPDYRPQDRLLVRRADQLIGHARLARREIHFGPARLPIAGLADLAMLHEYRGQGCGSLLLRAAEQRMVERGAVLAALRTRAPQFFLRRGWCVAARHNYSVARPGEILSLLRERAAHRPSLLATAETPVTIRHWRQVERAALMRLYEQNAAGSYGPVVRSEAYWTWLLNRQAYGCLYVAIEGPDTFSLQDSATSIVSYGVVRDGRIVELMTASTRPRAGEQLLMRVCSDAMEHDLPAMRIDAAPHDPIHQLFIDAHGERHCHDADHGDVYLIKTLDPLALLERLADLLHLRAQNGSLPNCGLGLRIAERRFRISRRAQGVHVEEARPGRHYLECEPAAFTQLVLGHLDLHAATESGRIRPSSRAASDLAAVLFPRVPLWVSPWDHL